LLPRAGAGGIQVQVRAMDRGAAAAHQGGGRGHRLHGHGWDKINRRSNKIKYITILKIK
jgi:hypothetical protein